MPISPKGVRLRVRGCGPHCTRTDGRRVASIDGPFGGLGHVSEKRRRTHSSHILEFKRIRTHTRNPGAGWSTSQQPAIPKPTFCSISSKQQNYSRNRTLEYIERI